MPNPKVETRVDLMNAVGAAWSDLQAFLSSLTSAQWAVTDEQGWTIGDHVAHLAVWEDSVAILFRGGARHEALGVDEPYYLTATFDELNATIRQRRGPAAYKEVVDDLRRVHDGMLEAVASQSDEGLHRSVRSTFPQAPRSDARRLVDFIHENTAAHFAEHLVWMRKLAGQAAEEPPGDRRG